MPPIAIEGRLQLIDASEVGKPCIGPVARFADARDRLDK